MIEKRSGYSRWVDNLLRPAVIATMMVCLAAPPVMGLEWLLAGWDGTYFLIFCFAAGLEGLASERLLRHRKLAGWQAAASRAAELVVLLLVLKIANTLYGGFGTLSVSVRNWVADPDSILTPVDGATWALLVPLWLGAVSVSRHVSHLVAADDQLAPPDDKTSTAYYLWLTRPSAVQDREEILRWLSDSVIWGGIAMLGVSTALYVALPESRMPVVAILVYSALGVALLSQARFSVHEAAWRAEGILVQRTIGGRWLVWALVFLAGVAAFALVLPTQYAMGPVLAVYNLIILLARFLAYVLGMLFYLLGKLMPSLAHNPELLEPPELSLEELPFEQQAEAAGAAPTWWGFFLTLVFWAVILAIVVFALVRVFKDRLGLLTRPERAGGRWWGSVLAWLASVWRRWRAWRQGLRASASAWTDRLSRRRRESGPVARLTRFLSLRRLAPRELVRYFYLSTERRATQAGQPRSPGQTPYEYLGTLDERFSDLEPDLSGLTDAFVQARYSRDPVQKEEADAVRPLWQRIKTALRRKRLGGLPGSE